MTEVLGHDDGTHEERKKTKEEIVDEEVTPGSKLNGHKKRKLKSMADDGDISMSLRLYKRILLSVSKPSYVLGLGAQNVRFENHEKLYILLRKMMRRHNWAEGSGVLSVLLQGTSKDRCPSANRAKFRASLGLLKHIHGDSDISKKIEHTYDIWSKRVKPSKDQRVEDKLMVDLEHIVTNLALGDDDSAFDGASGLKQLNEFRNLPMSYMFMGLTNYQRLYSGIRKTWQLEDSDQIYSPSTSDMSGHKLVSHAGNFEWQESIYSDNADTQFQCCSSVSVNNDQRISIENDSNLQNEVSMEADAKFQSGNSPVFVQPLNACHNSEDSDVSFDQVNDQMDYAHYAKTFSILVKQGLDPWLFPLRLPDSDANSEDASDSDENNEILIQMHEKILKDNYKDAVKYLWQALQSEPPILPALLPYIQLLMIGGQVHEALSELEKFSSSSASLPSRLRASIMECYDRNNYIMLASCFEDTLKKDPTCSHSMAKLIGIHQTGNYNTESLLEMIALHLDCSYAEYNTWREFAQCFLRFSDDRLSVCLNENADGQRERISIRYDRVPDLFTKRNSKKSWTVRCKWWTRRHFNKKMLASDSTAGNLQLLAYKASCASHMYGQDFHYVVKAHECLQRENSSELLKFLVMHMKNSLGLYSSFQSRTKL